MISEQIRAWAERLRTTALPIAVIAAEAETLAAAADVADSVAADDLARVTLERNELQAQIDTLTAPPIV